MAQTFNILQGDVLSLDPGTNICGVALWRDGVFIASRALRASNSSASVSRRLREVSEQLRDFLRLYSADVKVVIAENPDHTLLKAMVGAILATEGVDSGFNDKYTVGVMEWKAWARARGASHPDGFKYIKGVAALRSAGFSPLPTSDDEADAILCYLAYRDKYGEQKAFNRNKRRNLTKAPGRST